MSISFVIHLNTSTARAPIIEGLRQGLPNLRTLEAVDGRVLSAADRKAVYQPGLCEPPYPFEMLPSEIGCFLSHRKAWAALIASGSEYGYVAEDDVVLGPEFPAARGLAETNMTADRLIRFPMTPREEALNVVAQQGDLALFRPDVIGLTAALYLVGRRAAARLLEASERFDRPVDTWLQMRWDTGVDSLTLWPAGITSAAASHGGSTIQKKKTKWGEVSRLWNRARYRAAIASRSAKP